MDIFVARQPIFDVKKQVIAYELLFRNSLKNVYNHSNGDQATSAVLNNSFFSLGLKELTRGKRAFINFTRNTLLNGLATIFPSHLIGLEILETVEPEPELVAACKKLKDAGYLLVLDDFVFQPKYLPLVELASIIKVDFRISSPEQREKIISDLQRNNLKFLAEKVEDQEDFNNGLELGYHYFQGYFFSKPDIIKGRDLPGYKLNYLRIMQTVHLPDIEFKQLEEIIKQDISLSYKLLKLINSAAFGLSRKIESILQALVLLGIQEIKKWVSLIALTNVGKDKPEELITTSLVRAKFLETIADRSATAPSSSGDYFLLGLFSMIDALMDRPKSEILEELPIAPEIKAALLGNQNKLKEALDLVIFYENGDWEKFSKKTKNIGLDEEIIPEIYTESLAWTNRIFTAS